MTYVCYHTNNDRHGMALTDTAALNAGRTMLFGHDGSIFNTEQPDSLKGAFEPIQLTHRVKIKSMEMKIEVLELKK